MTQLLPTEDILSYKFRFFFIGHLQARHVQDRLGSWGNSFHLSLYLNNSPKRNGEYQADFSFENKLAYLITKFQSQNCLSKDSSESMQK